LCAPNIAEIDSRSGYASVFGDDIAISEPRSLLAVKMRRISVNENGELAAVSEHGNVLVFDDSRFEISPLNLKV
jgi:hypothetical protein